MVISRALGTVGAGRRVGMGAGGTRQAVQPAVCRFLDSRLWDRLLRSVGAAPAKPTLRRNSRSAAQKHSTSSASRAAGSGPCGPWRAKADARNAGINSTQWSAAWLPPWPSKTPKHVMVDSLPGDAHVSRQSRRDASGMVSAHGRAATASAHPLMSRGWQNRRSSFSLRIPWSQLNPKAGFGMSAGPVTTTSPPP